ncbi:MAG: TRAP transporter small permease [Kiloniellales bacterium]|nr:TRAP transporter small permease [Kiloniellales bacterium]
MNDGSGERRTDRTRDLVGKLAAAWAITGGVVLLAIVLVTTANAGAFALDRLARAFGGTVSGLPGYEDFVRLAISAAALMLLPYCQLRRGHVAVDLFAKWLPPRVRGRLDAAIALAMAALAAFLAFWMTLGLLETRADGALSRVLGWPEWPFYLPGIASLLLWAAVAGLQAFEGEDLGRA